MQADGWDGWKLNSTWKHGNKTWHDTSARDDRHSVPALAPTFPHQPLNHVIPSDWRKTEIGVVPINGFGTLQRRRQDPRLDTSWRSGDPGSVALGAQEAPEQRARQATNSSSWRLGEQVHLSAGCTLMPSTVPQPNTSSQWRGTDDGPIPLVGGERNSMKYTSTSAWRRLDDAHLSVGFEFGSGQRPQRRAQDIVDPASQPASGLFSDMGRSQNARAATRNVEWRQGAASDMWPPSPPRARVSRLPQLRTATGPEPSSPGAHELQRQVPQRQFQKRGEGESPRHAPVRQELGESWRRSMHSPDRPAGSPIKTATNAFGRLPPPNNVNFALINTDVTTQLRGRPMPASQSMPAMGVMKQEAMHFEDKFRKVAAALISEPRHGRRKRVEVAPHYNSTIHA